MNVTLPNGRVITGVPEGTTKEQIRQKAIAAGLAAPEDFGAPAQPQQPTQAVNTDIMAAGQQQPNFAQRAAQGIQEMFTGEQRTGRDIERTPSLFESDFLADLPATEQAKIVGLAQITSDPDELAQIVAQQVPDTQIQYNRDEQGNVYPVLRRPDGRAAIVDKPGMDLLNVGQIAAQAAAFTPAGKAATIPGAIGAEAATEAALQGVQSLAGGEFNPEAVGIAAGTAGLGKAAQLKLADIAQQRRLRSLVTPEGDITPDFERAIKREGLTIDSVVDDIADLPEIDDPRRAARALVKQKLIQRDADGALATKRLDDFGNVVDDPVGESALKQGLQPGDVQAIKVANPGSKSKMQEMLKIRQAIFGNTRKAVDMQPTDVIGRSAMSRFNHIRKTANQARRELDSIASRQLKGQQIDTGKIESAFRQQLANRDIGIDDSVFPPKLDFTGSEISKNRAAQKVIKDTMDLLTEDRAPDALRAHKLKRQLDEMIDYKKSGQGMLTPSGERVAKAVRKALNDSIREVNEDYARVNDTLSRSLDAINDFRDVLGPSINPFDEGAERAVGRDLRGLLSNRKTQTKLENAVTQLDQVAKELGGEFDDDLGDLVNFNSILQNRFGSTRRESFAGQIGSEIERTGRQMLQGRGGLVERGLETAGEMVEKARNINDQEAFKVINRLLRESK